MRASDAIALLFCCVAFLGSAVAFGLLLWLVSRLFLRQRASQ